MRHTIHLSVVAWFGLLLIPAGTQGQSFNANDSQKFSTTPVWIQEVSDLGVIKDIATGKDGEVYIAGIDMLAKYNPDGTRKWVRKAVSKHSSYIYLVAAGEDYIYTSEAEIWDIAPEWADVLDGSERFSGFGVEIGIRNLDGESSGELPEVSSILGLDLDETGNIYIAGVYRNLNVFGADTLFVLPTSFQDGHFIGHDVFVASYTPEGAPRWVRRIAGYGFDTINRSCRASDAYLYNEGRGVFTVDSEGNTYLGGCFGASPVLPFDQPGEITFTEDARALASFDADGNLRWLRTLADLGVREEFRVKDHHGDIEYLYTPYIWDMATDAERNLFTIWGAEAWQNKPVVVGGVALADPGGSGAFLVKHNPEGDILWVRQIAGKGGESICTLATDSQGDVYIGGFFDSSVLQIEETQLIKSGGSTNGFIVRYDGEGNVRWVGHVAGEGVNIVYLVAVSFSGDLYGLSRSILFGCLPGRYVWPYEPEATAFLAKYAASTITSSEPAPEIPVAATLTSNYPNPFARATTIEYALLASGPVRLVVYDALGREVATLADGAQHAGRHTVVFDGMPLPSGVYLYRLETGGQATTGLMTLRK